MQENPVQISDDDFLEENSYKIRKKNNQQGQKLINQNPQKNDQRFQQNSAQNVQKYHQQQQQQFNGNNDQKVFNWYQERAEQSRIIEESKKQEKINQKLKQFDQKKQQFIQFLDPADFELLRQKQEIILLEKEEKQQNHKQFQDNIINHFSDKCHKIKQKTNEKIIIPQQATFQDCHGPYYNNQPLQIQYEKFYEKRLEKNNFQIQKNNQNKIIKIPIHNKFYKIPELSKQNIKTILQQTYIEGSQLFYSSENSYDKDNLTQFQQQTQLKKQNAKNQNQSKPKTIPMPFKDA